MLINLPESVHSVLQALARAGHEAFLVGGCVRDAYLGQARKKRKKPAELTDLAE